MHDRQQLPDADTEDEEVRSCPQRAAQAPTELYRVCRKEVYGKFKAELDGLYALGEPTKSGPAKL